MPLDLWFRDDISRILAATHETFRASAAFRCDSAPAPDPLAAEATLAYQQGFSDALRAIALAFGVGSPASRAGAPAACETPRFTQIGGSASRPPGQSLPYGWPAHPDREGGRL